MEEGGSERRQGLQSPLALLSSDRCHRELIPSLAGRRPARHPAGCRQGHPGRSDGPCGHPSLPGEVRNPAMLHLPSAQVASLASQWLSAVRAETCARLGTETLQTVCTFEGTDKAA